jgi:hypothetical protein
MARLAFLQRSAAAAAATLESPSVTRMIEVIVGRPVGGPGPGHGGIQGRGGVGAATGMYVVEAVCNPGNVVRDALIRQCGRGREAEQYDRHVGVTPELDENALLGGVKLDLVLRMSHPPV